MNKYYLIAALFLFADTSGAASAPIDIKGVTLGMSRAQVRTTIGGEWVCYADGLPPSYRAKHKDDPDECGHPLARQGHARDSYAGIGASIGYFFQGDTLVKISVGDIVPGDFDTVHAALVSKFGKPDDSKRSEVNNRMGAKFDDVVSSWSAGDARLVFEKRCGAVDQTCLVVESIAYDKAQADSKAAKARTDL